MASKKNNILQLHAGENRTYNAAQDRENNYLGKKIAEGRAAMKLSLGDFQILLREHGIDVTRSAINKWELGVNIPNAYQLMAIGQALQVDEDYGYFMSSGVRGQLNRAGIQRLMDYRTELIATGFYEPESEVDETYREMPVSSLPASAGTGQFLDEGNYEMISFPESAIPKGADFGVRVAGDSMEPVYHDGQIVWVQQCDMLNVGTVGIFVYDGEGYIKVYGEQLPDESVRGEFMDEYGNVRMQPVLISYNQKYEPRKVSANANFMIAGRVL